MDILRRVCISVILAGSFSLSIHAQSVLSTGSSIRQSSWKQRVDHEISTRLLPASQTLVSAETVTYTNNSPGALKEIWFHIWPNAFKDNHTAYGKEAIRNGNFRYYGAPEADRGHMDLGVIKVNGQAVSWYYHPEHKDIIRLDLPVPLETGNTAIIEIPFTVKLPWLFSRMGVNEGIYAVTQWYPKPAVFDVNGWNVFPYAEQGEYYSEFGTYTVNITLPADYRVGATGKLLDTSEWNWMKDLAADFVRANPVKGEKTLHYVQENVSDFAWFASPDFGIKMDAVTLADSHRVTTLAFTKTKYKSGKIHQTDGKKILSGIENALTYYSRRVGYYPYDFCSVVIGPLQGAGGMEYPMITICGDASEGTIVHEVGHNWFQGMLGSQERRYPWMDESINTFYHGQAAGEPEKEFSPGDKINANSFLLQFRLTQDMGLFQAGNLASSQYHPFNYGTIVYGVNPKRFYYLQEYLGHKIFDSCMHVYFKNWQYRHPLPGDLQDVFETVSRKNLSGFFEGLLGGSAPDYSIRVHKKNKDAYEVKIKNHSDFAVPVKLAYRHSTLKREIWLDGNDTTVVVKGKQDAFSLNPSGQLPESNYANNDIRARGIFRRSEKIKIGFPGLKERGVNRIWVLPNIFSGNHYDGYMPGLVISNFNIPRRHWEFWLAPMYGVKSKTVTGTGLIQRNIFHKKGPVALTEISFRYAGYSFKPDSSVHLNQYFHYAPVITFYLKRNRYWIQNILELETDLNRIKNTHWSDSTDALHTYSPDLQNQVASIRWVRNVYRKISPEKYVVEFETGKNIHGLSDGNVVYGFSKISALAEKLIPYPNKKKKPFGLFVRGFATSMLGEKNAGQSKGVFRPVISGANGSNDYAFRQTMFRRSETFGNNSVWNNQLLPGSAGLRMPVNILAKSWVAGLNLSTHVIPGSDLQVFGDVVAANTVAKSSDIFWCAGLCYSQRLANQIFWEMNLPLVYSKNAQAGTSPDKFYSYLNFRIKLNIYKPADLIRNVYQ